MKLDLSAKIVVVIFVLFVLFAVLSQVWSVVVYVDSSYFGEASDLSNGYGSGDTIKLGHTVSAGDDRLLVVGLAVRGGEAAMAKALWKEGGSATELTRAVDTSSGTDSRVELWYLVNPTLGTDTICIVTASGLDPVSVSASNFTNVLQATPIGNTATGIGDGTEPNLSLTTANDSSTAISLCSQMGHDMSPYTPLNSQTEIYDTFTGTSDYNDITYWIGYISVLSAGAQPCSLDGPGTDGWAMVAMEIRHISEAAGGVTVEPDPASTAATAVNPTVVQSSMAIAPDAATAAATGVDPTVIKGSITLSSLAEASAVATAVNPTVDAGGYPQRSTIHYLATNGVDGGENNNGNHPDSAWATLNYAESQMSGGDTLFIMGGTYTEAQQLNGIPAGSDGSPTVIKAYGDAVAYFGETGGTTRGERWYVDLDGTNDYVTIDGFSYLSPTDSLFLYFYADSSEDTSPNMQYPFQLQATEGNRLDHMTIRGIKFDGLPIQRNYSGVLNDATGMPAIVEADWCRYLLFESNWIQGAHIATGPTGEGNDTGRNQGTGEGIYCQALFLSTIQKNTFKRCNHGAILIQQNGSTYSSYNKIRYNFIEQYWGGGIYINRNSRANLIEGNVITHCGESTSFLTSADGKSKPGIQLSGPFNTVRGNVIYNPHNHGLSVESHLDAGVYMNADSNAIYNNTVFETVNFLLYIQNQGSDNNDLRSWYGTYYNNLFYKGVTGARRTGSLAVDSTTVAHFFDTYSNDTNNWLDPDIANQLPTTTHFGQNDFHNNLWCRDSSGTKTTLSYARMVTYARDATYGDSYVLYSLDSLHSADATAWTDNVAGNPSLTSDDPDTYGINSGWWYLPEGSNCIDAGRTFTDTIGTYVEGLHAGYGWSDTLVWHGTAPDIGAYESEGNILVTPSAAIAMATAVDPTTDASMTLFPAAASAVARAVNPAVDGGIAPYAPVARPRRRKHW